MKYLALAGLLLLWGCAAPPAKVAAPVALDQYVAAVNAYQAGQIEQARRTLEKAIAVNPDLTMARSMLGGIYLSDNRWEAALAQYQALDTLDPYSSDNAYHLGVCYQLLNQLLQAEKSYFKALALDPKDSRSAVNLSLVELSLGKIDAAMQWAKTATELNHASAAAWTHLGMALDARGEFVQAEQAYRRALELPGPQGPILRSLATNLLYQQRPTDAMALLKQLIAAGDSASLRKRLGDAYALRHDLDSAAREYRAALLFNPGYTSAMNELASTLMEQYRKGLQLDESLPAEAHQWWQRSLRENPNQPKVAQLLRGQ